MLEAKAVDDQLLVLVNGVTAGSLHWGKPDRNVGGSGQIDLGPWLKAGTNVVNVHVANGSGGRGFDYSLRADGTLVGAAQCGVSDTCAAMPNQPDDGLFHSARYVVNGARNVAKAVTVTGPAGAPVFVNGRPTLFTTPATLHLADGSYDIGIGLSSERPDPAGQFAYTGSFLERRVTVTGDTTLDLTNVAPKAAKTWKLAVLPIRTTVHGDAADPRNQAVLTDAQISYAVSRTRATGTRLAGPLSFGLVRWEVTVLPVVEATKLYRGATSADPGGQLPDTDRLLREADLTGRYDSYDTVMYLYGTKTASGQRVPFSPCCGWGGGKGMWISDGFVGEGVPAEWHNEGLLHEWLHGIEWYQKSVHGLVEAIGGLHAADRHGYPNDPHPGRDWEHWYRDFMRSMAVETTDMAGIERRASPPARELGSALTGVFETMYRGPTAAAESMQRKLQAPVIYAQPLSATDPSSDGRVQHHDHSACKPLRVQPQPGQHSH